MKKIKELYKKYEELVNYVIVGVLTTIVSLGSYYLCVLTVFNPDNPILLQSANVISWILAVTFAYIANRKYVFKSKNPNIFKEATKFYGARIVTLLIDMLFMFITVSVFHFNDKIMKILSNVIILILNYIISKFIVFIKKEDKNEKK